MDMRSLIFSILILSTAAASAAPMVRIVDVKDAQTIVVDRNGVAAEVRLAGVLVPPAEQPLAVTWLRETLVWQWAMIENGPEGAYVYRSPDALYINGEIARRAYTNARTPMVYLGEVDPGPKPAAKTPRTPAPVRVRATPKTRRVRHAPSGAHKIPRL
jgi:hypothetical protein